MATWSTLISRCHQEHCSENISPSSWAWVQSCQSTGLFIFAKNVNTGRIPLFPNCCVKLPLQGERLLFLRGADWGEATKEAGVSRRLQTPVVLQAVNTSPFTAGNGTHLDPSCQGPDKARTITSWAQLEGLLNYKSPGNRYWNFLFFLIKKKTLQG